MKTLFKPSKIDRVILFIHGMQDYSLRYTELCEKLKAENSLVILPDLKGHGQRKPHGYIGGFEEQTDELIALIKEYKEYPKIVIGHSMGSLFARNMLIKEPNLFDLVILSGSPANNPLVKPVSNILKITNRIFKQDMKQSRLLNRFFNYQFNQKVKNPQTPIDWISYNQENVQYFLNSPYCGFDFTNSSFVDLFEMLGKVNKKEQYSSKTPVLLLSGVDDPCLNNQMRQIESVLGSNGHPVSSILYPNSRHEILFDYDKEQVESDILKAVLFDI